MLIDTHCHLDFKDFDTDRDEVMDRARGKGVGLIVNIGSSVEGSRRSVELARKYGHIYASVGVHPHDAKSVTDNVITEIKELAKDEKVIAIGEVGLDYYRNLSPKEIQIEAFKKFIELAHELGLPLILHSREAGEEMLNILTQYARHNTQYEIKGVMHCFSGDEKFLKECLGLGLFVSFTCNITFKNAKALREVAKRVPPERLLLETDAPFLAPEGARGKRNEPANVAILADEWSKILGLSRVDIERITTHNANALFGLGLEEGSQVAYRIRDSLYLNITNRCTNSCGFCVRQNSEFVKGHRLKLEREPDESEILKAAGDVSDFKEVVFCGYGEPTIRLELVKSAAKELRRMGAKRVRLVTNGHGDIINSRPIAKELKGLVDKVSVSLNTDSEDSYNSFCKPEFGPGTYGKVIDFVKSCTALGIEVEVTCLDLEGVDAGKCEQRARELGASFRLRHLGVVG